MSFNSWISRRSQGLAFALLAAAVLLVAHQFAGVRHDGILYAGEALARIVPGEFHDDLYFLFGSQGRFTAFPFFYGKLIAVFGLGNGTIVGLLVAHALYLGAAWYVIAALAPPKWRIVCVLSVVLGWNIYGGQRVFAYAEPFLTSRSFAEPAVLFAVGLLLRRKIALTALALLIALAIHPLIAAGGVLTVWICLVADDRRWTIPAAIAALAFAVLAIVGWGPFSDVLARYDGEWLALVQEANPQAFLLQWTLADYGVVVFNLGVLWLAAGFTEKGRLRSLIVASAMAGVGATLVSFVLVDLLHNPFFGKLQIWRAEWLMQWMAMANFPLVLIALWKRGEAGRVAALFLLIGWMAPFSVVPGLLAVMATSLYGMRHRVTVSPATTRIVAGVAFIAACAIAIQYEIRAFTLGELLKQPLKQMVGQALTMNLVLMAAALLFVRAQARLRVFAPILALVMFAGALLMWDQRAPWTRRLESYPVGTHIWPGLIEPNARVYWYRDLFAPWVLLGHGNYYTMEQGSGAVFSRDLVFELDKRRKVTAMIDFQEQICRMMNGLNQKATSCEPDVVVVRAVCTDGGIDYIVLQNTLEGATPLANFSTGIVENGYEKRFYLYRCSALQQG